MRPERLVPGPIGFSKELWIEDDFSENPPKGYRKTALATEEKPAAPVRLRHAYVVEATHVDRDENGKVIAVHAKYYPGNQERLWKEQTISKPKQLFTGFRRKDSLPAEIRLYDRLFSLEHPDEGGKDFRELLTPDSKTILKSYVETSLKNAKPEDKFQFERNGYYVADQKTLHLAI